MRKGVKAGGGKDFAMGDGVKKPPLRCSKKLKHDVGKWSSRRKARNTLQASSRGQEKRFQERLVSASGMPLE